jgi:hypothetical protein
MIQNGDLRSFLNMMYASDMEPEEMQARIQGYMARNGIARRSNLFGHQEMLAAIAGENAQAETPAAAAENPPAVAPVETDVPAADEEPAVQPPHMNLPPISLMEDPDLVVARRMLPGEYVAYGLRLLMGEPVTPEETPFDTPTMTDDGLNGRQIGGRRADHFDEANGTIFEGTLLEWSQMDLSDGETADRFWHKLTEAQQDVDLAGPNGDHRVQRAVWFAPEPLNAEGPVAARLRDILMPAINNGLVHYVQIPHPTIVGNGG